MPRNATATRAGLGLVVLLLILPRAGSAQPIWTPTDLGTLGGATSTAFDINNAGQVVGTSAMAGGGSHPFLWTTATGMVDLGSLGGIESAATGINSVGMIVGRSQTSSGEVHAFVWTTSGGMVDIGTMNANDINDAGQVVGDGFGSGHAFLWTAAYGATDLGTLGGAQSGATAVNNIGHVVGWSQTAAGSVHAFLWTAAGGMVDLGTLGGASSSADGINDAGQVVGESATSGGPCSHAFLWTAAAGMVDLGTLGGLCSSAADINANGQVVGVSNTHSDFQHAFVWTPVDGMVDLGARGQQCCSNAQAINDAGQIAGGLSGGLQPRHALLWLQPLIVRALTSSTTFPVVAGTPVTWTASTTGGLPSFQFWVFNGTTWMLGRDWSDSPKWTWEPALPGTYTIQVWARNAGSSASYDAWLGTSATISTPSVLTITGVTPSPTSEAAGRDVTWTVTAAGGRGPYTYTFFVFDGASWTVGQDWSGENTWMWTPPKPGTYLFQVWVRNAGSAAAYDAWRAFGPYTATRPASLTVTTFTPDVALPAPGGTPVTWTATAAGGTGPYTYKFWEDDCSVVAFCRVAQDWSEANTFTWLAPTPNPGAAGSFGITVWVRNAGSTALYDVASWRIGLVSEPSALQVSVASDRTFPLPAGTPVTWTARGVGGTGPYTFKFWIFDGSTWRVGQDWSASANWTWVPLTPGSYFVQAWIRNSASSSAYDAWSGTSALAIASATTLRVATLTTAPMSSLFSREGATVSATAVGGIGPYTYEFWIYDGSTWTVGQTWSPSSTYAWRPTASGTYWIQAWVRNAGSTSPYDAWSGLGPLTVLP